MPLTYGMPISPLNKLLHTIEYQLCALFKKRYIVCLQERSNRDQMTPKPIFEITRIKTPVSNFLKILRRTSSRDLSIRFPGYKCDIEHRIHSSAVIKSLIMQILAGKEMVIFPRRDISIRDRLSIIDIFSSTTQG